MDHDEIVAAAQTWQTSMIALDNLVAGLGGGGRGGGGKEEGGGDDIEEEAVEAAREMIGLTESSTEREVILEVLIAENSEAAVKSMAENIFALRSMVDAAIEDAGDNEDRDIQLSMIRHHVASSVAEPGDTPSQTSTALVSLSDIRAPNAVLRQNV